MKKDKKHKIQTPGYYFTYEDRQHPMFKDQTEKWALLFEESNGQLISDLNTEADKVNGMDKFTHEEVIGWFDSILNPVESKGAVASEAIEFAEWLRTFEPLDKTNGFWVLESQISSEELYKNYLRDRERWRNDR